MAGKEKPYTLYRGGRAKGPLRPLREQAEPRRERDGYRRDDGRRRVVPRRWRRMLVLALVGAVLLALVWALLGFLAVRRGVAQANDRLSERARAALAAPAGSILTNATNTLVLGADVGGKRPDRQGIGRSDSIMLVRTDPDEHRLAYLSIPRDLRVEIPGHGVDKINAAYSLGGPALATRTVRALTGLRVNHVVVVDFSGFREVIDAIGGITIDNPKPVLSNPFDCPFTGAEACAEKFKGWRFRKGEIHLDGRRALIYSRIRKNQLNPSESDITRGERQQRVLQGLADKVVSLYGYLHMPFIGDDLVNPLATDLSAGQLLQLAWVRRRAAADKTLRCRLGGTPTTIGGIDYLQSSEDNVRVVDMIRNRDSAAQPPAPGDPFAPGCFVGRARG
ncbi:MAG: LCP family protein [Thermoleophilia bacterium]|nr:LCP family protein [Thermoleophilia bacterium]